MLTGTARVYSRPWKYGSGFQRVPPQLRDDFAHAALPVGTTARDRDRENVHTGLRALGRGEPIRLHMIDKAGSMSIAIEFGQSSRIPHIGRESARQIRVLSFVPGEGLVLVGKPPRAGRLAGSSFFGLGVADQFLVCFDQFFNDRGIGQGGDVTHFVVLVLSDFS